MPSQLALLGDPQHAGGVDRLNIDGHGDDEGGAADDDVAPDLGPQLLVPPPQNRPFDAVPNWPVANRPTAHVPQMPAHAVHGDGADRVVDAQVLDEVDAEHDDDAGDEADDHRADGVDPVARAGDRHEAAEEAVDRDADVPLLEPWIDARPSPTDLPAAAASVVLVATRPMPAESIADSVLPGLKPYQPNHRITPPSAAMVRSWPGGRPPPSRLNLRPRRGPSTIAPARAIMPPIVCTTVEPAKSRMTTRRCAAVCSQPPGPQTQWPRIG